MVHAGSVFVAGIHPSRTWMSGSLESLWWNACVHRLDLNLYSHPQELGGMESEPTLFPLVKFPLPEKFSSEEDQTHNAASRTASPTHYQWAVPAPARVKVTECGIKSYRSTVQTYEHGMYNSIWLKSLHTALCGKLLPCKTDEHNQLYQCNCLFVASLTSQQHARCISG